MSDLAEWQVLHWAMPLEYPKERLTPKSCVWPCALGQKMGFALTLCSLDSWLLTDCFFWLLTKQLCCFRNGRLLGVCASVDNCRLFVGGIPKTKKREEILAEMKKVTDGVVDVIVYPSAADKTKNRGFAFVEYESHRAAAMARRKLLPGEQGWGGVTIWGHHQGTQESKEVNVAGFSALRQQFSALRQQFSARHTQSLEVPQHTVGCGIHCSSCCSTVLVIHGCPSGAWVC